MCGLPLLFLCRFPGGLLSPLAEFLFAALGFLLPRECLGLQFGNVVTGTLPRGIENKALVVFGLGQNARPSTEELGCGLNGARYSL